MDGITRIAAERRRRIVWTDIAGGLQALYDVFDPDGLAYDVIDAGAERGGTFQQVTGVW